MDSRYAIGFDIGGTQVRAALFEVETLLDLERPSHEPHFSHKEFLGNKRTPAELATTIARIVSEFEERVSETKIPVGFGLAGMVRSTDGFVIRSPHLKWSGVHFGSELGALWPGRSWVIDNDVNAIVVGEHRYGAGAQVDDMLAVFFGTGIGSGVIANGQLLRGQGAAAELGHTKVQLGPEGRVCACGERGCAEAYLGGANVLARIRADRGRTEAALMMKCAGDMELDPSHLDQAATQGDAYALAIYEEIAPLGALALANAVTLLNPQRLVLGGGLLRRTPLLRSMMMSLFNDAVNPVAGDGLEVISAHLGDHAGTLGSAFLAYSADQSNKATRP